MGESEVSESLLGFLQVAVVIYGLATAVWAVFYFARVGKTLWGILKAVTGGNPFVIRSQQENDILFKYFVLVFGFLLVWPIAFLIADLTSSYFAAQVGSALPFFVGAPIYLGFFVIAGGIASRWAMHWYYHILTREEAHEVDQIYN